MPTKITRYTVCNVCMHGLECFSIPIHVILFAPLITISCVSADINECSDEALNNCHSDAICVNEVGNFSCACRPGYRGDGVSCEGVCHKMTCSVALTDIVLQISTSVMKRLITVSTHLATTREAALCVETVSLGSLD